LPAAPWHLSKVFIVRNVNDKTMRTVIRKYWKLFVVLSLPLQVLLIQWISGRPELVERLYTGSFYKNLSHGLRAAFGGITVPVGQIVFYSLVLACLIGIISLLIKVFTRKISIQRFFASLAVNTLVILSVFHFFFMGMWGLNYYRTSVSETARISKAEFSPEQLEKLATRLVALTNESRSRIDSEQLERTSLAAKHQHILSKATDGYVELAKQYPSLEYSGHSVKSVYVPELMSYFRVGGIYFPFTGEANVNMHQPEFSLPATTCHEMAHQIGFASEDEANFIAYLACRFNPDPVFQYSGNLMAMRYAMGFLRKVDEEAFERLKEQFSDDVKADLEIERAYWSRYNNPFLKFSSAFYDLFLKANGQSEGIESYSRIVDLLVGEYQKNGLDYSTLKQ
jgi:hypothetical protein